MDRDANDSQKRPSSYHAGYGEEGVKQINEKQLMIAENGDEAARRFFLLQFIDQNTFGTAKDESVVTIRKMAGEYNCQNVIATLNEIDDKKKGNRKPAIFNVTYVYTINSKGLSVRTINSKDLENINKIAKEDIEFFLLQFNEDKISGIAKNGSVVTIREMAEEYNFTNVIKALGEIERKEFQ